MYRVGFGYDVHRFAGGRKLILGGIEIPYEKGLEGHSDADVLCHAIGDALLGGSSSGDIGHLFPDTDKKYKDISSLILLKKINGIIKSKGYYIENIDSTILLEQPKVEKYIDDMRVKLAQTLEIEFDRISVKATTSEKMGFVGKKEGVAAYAVILLGR
ncbi:2-C-methyl-D-erythritol 2,4-cyclodiphosphate synthase [candidate division KSB1 bacterium]|nr:MAG: 2-C-methyl-D-erythritol 2,4-cyclodiphosphate synthase [candidate division KSB1 bacterium]